MRQNYNSFDYWKNLISENSTIRGHMLMNTPPTNKSIYFHSLIFCKETGLNNIWGYFPDEMALVGYIQYSFLQEAFYVWINSREKSVTRIPSISVQQVIRDGEIKNRITKEEADIMRSQLATVTKMWSLPKNKILAELKKFARDFNRKWYGDNREFLYLKIFETSEELGNFVVDSSYMVSSEEEFKNRTTESVERWKIICKKATSDRQSGERFREILLKHLTEII